MADGFRGARIPVSGRRGNIAALNPDTALNLSPDANPLGNSARNAWLGMHLTQDSIGLALSRGLAGGRQIIDLATEPESSRDGQHLIGHIAALLACANSALDQIGGIALTAGPGGFTRVRVACAVAQGIALGQQIPVAAIHSMRAQALAAFRHILDAKSPGLKTHVCVLIDARMNEVYAGLWSVSWSTALGFELRCITEPGIVALAGLQDFVRSIPIMMAGVCHSPVLTGDGVTRYLSETPAMLGSRHVTPGPQDIALASLTLAEPADWVQPTEVTPIYLRAKVALNIAEQAALRASNRAGKSPQ